MNTIPPFAFCLMMYHGDVLINTPPLKQHTIHSCQLIQTAGHIHCVTLNPGICRRVGRWCFSMLSFPQDNPDRSEKGGFMHWPLPAMFSVSWRIKGRCCLQIPAPYLSLQFELPLLQGDLGFPYPKSNSVSYGCRASTCEFPWLIFQIQSPWPCISLCPKFTWNMFA